MDEKKNHIVASDVALEKHEITPDFTLSSEGFQLSEGHLQELRASAISDVVIKNSGVYTAFDKDQLPAWGKWVANRPYALPALVYPMTEVGGVPDATGQLKPVLGSLVNKDGDPLKYVSPRNDDPSGARPPVLVEVRPVTDSRDQILIVEGVKQALAAESYIPEGWAIWRICGIWSWKGGNDGPPAGFDAVQGKRVVIAPDADAASKSQVYAGAEALGQLCKDSGAKDVLFLRVPGGKTTGLDDALAKRSLETRPSILKQWIDSSSAKPADQRPPVNSGGSLPEPAPGVVRLNVGSDPQQLLIKMRDALANRLSGESLFWKNQSLFELRIVNGAKYLAAVDSGRLLKLLLDVCQFVSSSGKNGTLKAAFPPHQLVSALLTEWSCFEEVNGIVSVPIVHSDGSIVTKEGYDPESGLILDLGLDMQGIQVPLSPSDDEIKSARALLEDELLGDFPWKTPADKSRALAGLITPVIRSILPTSPLFLIAASQPGTGKNLLANVISLITSGKEIEVQTTDSDESELRKNLSARLMSGCTQLFFDEQSDGLESRVLSAFLTATRWSDRVLGSSEMSAHKNSCVVYAMGNNVDVGGDLVRRVIRVDLFFEDESPENRSGFKHADLQTWVLNNRKELLTAILTLVRAWFARGSVQPVSLSKPMGSFEKWHEIVAGVLETCGAIDLFEGVAEQKASNDYESEVDLAHFSWLSRVIDRGDLDNEMGFSARDVCVLITKDPSAHLPFRFSDSTDRPTPIALGRFYRSKNGVPHGGYRLKAIRKRYNTNVFRLDYPDDGGTDTSPVPTPTGSPVVTTGTGSVAGGYSVSFDLETGSVTDAHTASDSSFIRLAAWSVDGGDPVVSTDIGKLCTVLAGADSVIGHNILSYDLPLLERFFDLDVDRIVEGGRVRDTLILAYLNDPVPSGTNNVPKKYGLDEVARRFGVPGKMSTGSTSALDVLARQFGGFDQIPVDNETYRAYAAQDVRVAWELNQKFVYDDYARREHRALRRVYVGVSGGLSVDRDVVAKLLSEEAVKRSVLSQWFHVECDVPLVNGQGKAYKAPWATNAGKKAIAFYIESFGLDVPHSLEGGILLRKAVLESLLEQQPENVRLGVLVEQLALAREKSPMSDVDNHIRSDGRLYPSIQAQQSTGRFSMTNPGMTVFGSKTDRLRAQRAAILPDNEDEVLISVDLSQIDARCMAAGSGDMAYISLFEPGKDSHSEMAYRIFGDRSRRDDAKALAHAANYGMGASAFAGGAKLDLPVAESILGGLETAFPVLEGFKHQLREVAKATGFVITPFGRKVCVDPDKAWTQAPAAYGQSTARDVLMEAVLLLPEDLTRRIRIYVHDEIVLSVPAFEAQQYIDEIITAVEAVEIPVGHGDKVPIFAEAGGIGRNWSEC